MTKCTERIEQADNRGDSKTIYAEVKRLSGLVSRGANTRPTAAFKEEKGTAEPRSVKTQEELAKPQELAGERGKVTDASTRNNDKPEELDGERATDVTRKHEAAKNSPPGARGKSFESSSIIIIMTFI